MAFKITFKILKATCLNSLLTSYFISLTSIL